MFLPKINLRQLNLREAKLRELDLRQAKGWRWGSATAATAPASASEEDGGRGMNNAEDHQKASHYRNQLLD